jgi:hypothetical protein
MHFRFPPGTVILTIAEGNHIGYPVFGIMGQGGDRNMVVCIMYNTLYVRFYR